jgi:hypothetical protein
MTDNSKEVAMEIQSCGEYDGDIAYYVKGHVDLKEFMNHMQYEVDSDNPILKEQPTHTWMRVVRNFHEEMMEIVEAAPNSRGSFKCTWLQQGC